MGEEVLYRSARTGVSRQPAPEGAGTVVCKRAVGPGAVRRLEHERAVLRHLAGTPGVPRLAAAQSRQVLILLDDGGHPWTGRRLAVSRLLDAARSLADTIAAVHRAGVVHRDICPANVVLTDSGPPVLIDFDRALDDAEPPDEAPGGNVAGPVGYLAPEQTGRTGLPVDRRADLYGLGATLYALATGSPPFPGDDPLELIRDILIRTPPFPGDLNPRLPRRFGEIVMRLLEKDPDRRYQSAEGLRADLDRLATVPVDAWSLGELDFPAFLPAPARLVGRDTEIRRLAAALDRARSGGTPARLVCGAPGIGKSALLQTLRPAVAGLGGWFVAGKYDQFRTGTGSGGITRALRATIRLLLAEPEPDAAADRRRLTEALGPNAALVTAAVPEMAAFLGDPAGPAPTDPTTRPARLSATVVALLRAVTERRPVVFVLDDLQWASTASLRVVDAIVAAGPIPGLLLIGAYRDQEADQGALSALVARWVHEGGTAPPVRLAGLDDDGVVELTAALLRMAPSEAAGLARLTGEAGGNPYATVELINALRADGLLVLDDRGWTWQPELVRGFAARHRLPDLVTSRLAQQPDTTRRLLAALACLGGDTRPELLAAAVDLPQPAVVQGLGPAVADGLVRLPRADQPAGTVRFRHDLIQRAGRDALSPDERDRLHLAMARRLAARSDGRQEAAEQYLPVTHLVRRPRERREAAALLHAAGRRTAQLANYPVAQELLCAAAGLLAGTGDRDRRDAIAVDLHAALYCMGHLAEADDVHRDLVERSPTLTTLAAVTVTQVNSLAQRGAVDAALDLGLAALGRFGIEPPRDLAADVARGLDDLYRWAGTALDTAPPTTADPRVLAAGRLINRLLPPAFQRDPRLHAWLVVEAHRCWTRHGVCPPLIATLAAAVCVTIDQRADFRTGYLLTRYAATVGQRLGAQPEAAVARYMYLCLAAHWFEPVEDLVEPLQQTRDDLLAAGDVQVASLLSGRLLAVVLDSADSLAACAEEITPALAFAERTGSRYPALTMIGYRQLVHALRGETTGPGTFAQPGFDEDAYRAETAAHEPALATYHTNRALAALLFDDAPALDTHSAAALAHSRSVRGFYVSALARVVRCLCLTGRLGGATDDPAARELPAVRDWLARRAADMPHNFRPLLRLVDAEWAAARGDFDAATRDFDAGLQEAWGRPWHRARLAEQAGRFHLDRGLRHAGQSLLVEARDAYRRWGATGKVAQLEGRHPFLRATPALDRPAGTGDGTEGIDLMAVLRASRALSSQTTLAGLQAALGDVLSAMTGATHVRLVLRRPETAQWHAVTIAGSGAPAALGDFPLDAGADEHRLPMSALRYVLRTREPLLVADAAQDDRFARDPYVLGLPTCALLVMPIANRNTTQAVLMLENHGQRGVFSADRLGAVRLIAAQLSVSLDNALLYDSLERTVRARTADLAERNRELETANRLKADLIGMLGHEINNPLAMILGHIDLALAEDEMPEPARELVARIGRHAHRLDAIVHEVLALVTLDAGRLTATPRPVRVADHLRAALAATGATGVAVDCPDDLVAAVQPGHLDQILTNLLTNAAKYGGGATSIVATPADPHGATGRSGAALLAIEVRDSGPGVPYEFRDRLFDRFARAEPTAGTVQGTGLGLYIVRELARANGGDVTYRPAPGRGTIFVLTLPPAAEAPEPAPPVTPPPAAEAPEPAPPVTPPRGAGSAATGERTDRHTAAAHRDRAPRVRN